MAPYKHLLVALATLLLACSKGVDPEASILSEPAVLPSVGPRPLESHIPSVGLRWLVHLRPRDLVEDEELLADWEGFFQAQRVQAFTRASGIDPHGIREAWIAGYDLGVLYLLDARVVGERVEQAFVKRSLSTGRRDTGYANLSHVTGIIDQKPHALVHVGGHMVALAEGDIVLCRIVAAYAKGNLDDVPSALEARFLRPHATFEQNAPVRAFLLGPFENATDAVSAAFVSGVVAARENDGQLMVEGQALGVWPRGPELSRRLTEWTDQVLSTRALRALGWGFPTLAPEVTCEPLDGNFSRCQARGRWKSRAIAQALHRITAGSMRELIEQAPEGWRPRATTHDPDPSEAPTKGAPGGKKAQPPNESEPTPANDGSRDEPFEKRPLEDADAEGSTD